jgi:uncharacterized membrane protein YozB (DUF420 family)
MHFDFLVVFAVPSVVVVVVVVVAFLDSIDDAPDAPSEIVPQVTSVFKELW